MFCEEYPYLYETHLHTSQSSRCAAATGREMAQALKKAGYSGTFVTDHSWYGNHCINPSLPWGEWVHEFCRGYEDAKAWGDANDFSVFFGYESCYQGTEFLVYGVDEEWLIRHPEIRDATIEEQFLLIQQAGGIVVHAHPYRKEPYIPEIRLFPKWVHAVEGINATHSNPKSTSHNVPEYDALAMKYAKKYHLPMTAGSDVHSTSLFGGGMAFKEKLISAKDFCQRVSGGGDYVLTNGEQVVIC